MADPSAALVVELDLDHQLGPQRDPLELLLVLPAARVAVAALTRRKRREPLDQLTLLGGAQTRGVPDDPQRAGFVVEAEDQRADGPRLLARPVADDHGVDRPNELDLDHAGALAGPIGSAEVLGDDPLPLAQPGRGLLRIERQRRQADGLCSDTLLNPAL